MKKVLKYQISGRIFLSIIFCILMIPIIIKVSDILMFLQHNKNIKISYEIFSYILQYIFTSFFIEINIYSYFKQIISHDEELLINFNYINNFNETNRHKYKYVSIIIFITMILLIILIELFENIYTEIFFNKNRNYFELINKYNNLNYIKNIIDHIFVACIIAPFFEEYFCRVRYDYYFRFLKIEPWLMLNSLIFAFFHFTNPLSFIFIFLNSYFIFSLSYLLFKNYLLNVFLHSLANFFVSFFSYEGIWILSKYFKNIDYQKIYLSLYSKFSLITVFCFLMIVIYLYVKIVKKYIKSNFKIKKTLISYLSGS